MTIQHEGAASAEQLAAASAGWLEVDARWVAGLWGLQATGEVKCVLGKIHVGVRHPELKPGQIIVGNLAHAIVPTGFSPKAERMDS